MKNHENKRVAQAAGVVGMATLLSRIFGYIRDMVVAAIFGAGLVSDAFFAAFRMPNIMRRLLGEGSLTVSFVPVFTEYLKKKSKEEALELADIVFTILSIVLVILSIIGIIIAPLLVTIMAPGFSKTPIQFDLCVFLTRIMFPYIFFISLVALCMGILNSLRHFAAPALSPVVLNLSMILSTLLLRDYFREPITALAVGVIIGGALQLAMQWPFLVKMGVHLRLNFHFRHPGVRKMGVLLIPTFIGSSVYQINVLVGTILGSLLPKGSLSYLYYADRIVELPLGVFAIAVGTASLPSLSSQVARGQMTELKQTLSFSLRLILFITIPASVALIALRVPILSVLFERGAFTTRSTLLTAQALLFYTVGLWAFSVIRVIDAAFFALQDRISPLKAAAAALIVNVGASIILMYPLKHGGLALATSVASAVNVMILWVILHRRIGRILDRTFYDSLGKIILSSLVMWAALIGLEWFLPWNMIAPFRGRLTFVAASFAVGAITFFAASFAFKSPEVTTLVNTIRRKFSINKAV
ncbi:MAG: murein biosynthesis integral membrane protein MurJ [Syntrophales bacterium]|jgi:putative peptidoglycan lipid II flippase